MLSSAFANNLFISLALLILFSVILGLASLRRLHDAKLNKNWFLAPSLTFALIAMVIILSDQNSSYYLLIVPSLCSGVLLTYASAAKLNFILGYYGPIDMKEYQQESHQSKHANFRIEPTLITENAESAHYSEGIDNNLQSTFQSYEVEQNNNSQNVDPFNKQADIGEMIRLKILSNKKAQLMVAVLIGLTLIGVAASWFINYLQTDDETTIEKELHQKELSVQSSITRNYPLAMPDNYTLYLSEHRGVSINWQADEVSDTTLWSQLTAQGDESCKEISFNKGDAIRTLSVQVTNTDGANINYFADFSPLDSKTLIQALAFRGNFTLCGYNFSLKGSQAALGSNEQYAQWVDY